ncbi:MAG: M20 family metallopeptidase [Bacillota bacterium]
MKEEFKEKACAQIDRHAAELIAISKRLHAHPETRFKEYKASAWICEFLEKHEFKVEKGIGGLETAFKAEHRNISPGKKVAFLAEYDALPELGHACGHNLIAGASVGALLAFKDIKRDLPGAVLLFGTPGEEGGGGKIKMLAQNLFSGCDAALMFHPACFTTMYPATLALAEVVIVFSGKSSHAAANPDCGINALDGVLQTFSAINALRGYLRSDARIHGVITKGGECHNVIPAVAEAIFAIRAKDSAYVDFLVERLRQCAEGAALASGAEVTLRVLGRRKELRTNRNLALIFTRNLIKLKEKPKKGIVRPFSTDMGDVSQVIPSIHPVIAICDSSVGLHTKEFAAAAGSERGYRVMITAAKALAMTAIDLLMNGATNPKKIAFLSFCK